jgi:hypothetical protein
VNLQQEAGKDSFAVDDLEVSVEISNFKGDSEIVYLPMLPALAASSAGLGGGGSLQIFPTTTSSLSGIFLSFALCQPSYVMEYS